LRILLVEDDHILGSAVRDHLSSHAHSVDWMTRIDEAKLSMSSVDYELVLLDLGLPDGRGIDLLKNIRASNNTIPVIIATAQDQIATRIEGLNSGADDYIVKPFDLEELQARITAVARRAVGQALPTIEIQNVSIDIGRKTVSLDQSPIVLTAREFAVLSRLIRTPGAVVTTSEIEDSLYEFGAEIESNAVQVFVSRLRKKLGRDIISTVRGIGYQVNK